MSYFSISEKFRLARSIITKAFPLYVQFYITSRCNLSCQQCNIIYSYADIPEMNLDQIRAVAKNLRRIGTSIVLLIGGEPFVRKDLADIIRVFSEAGIHVRMQTNGFATRKRLQDCVDAGGKDISISLDTLKPEKQDVINGGFNKSFIRAMRAVADVNDIFPDDGTAFFGTVLMPHNLDDITKVIRFATRIGWGVSLVPVHTSSQNRPMGFRAYDDSLLFQRSQYARVAEVLEECRRMRNNGYLLYDSDEYLKDIYRFIVGKEIKWRRRNGGVCDSPNLYFAIEPDGSIAPCCDFRLQRRIPVYDDKFPEWFEDGIIHKEIYEITSKCQGCLFGSYPEMTISARYVRPLVDRARYFLKDSGKLKKLTMEEIIQIASEIEKEDKV